ncbi:hypothetical protein ACFYZ8_31905 [Streptomyces sp. NPDC001668]|uniref:hypothetical protein n=1 Tax=unclassified Streptomyces TaxID=2593676 RepID=UPI0036A39D31
MMQALPVQVAGPVVGAGGGPERGQPARPGAADRLARRDVKAHATLGIGYVAAPVFGRVSVVFDAIGLRTWRLGERPERANTVVNAVGADLGQFVELLASTLFPGPVYSGYGWMIAQRRYRPAGSTTALGRKDPHLALDAADGQAVSLPFGELLTGVFDQAIADGRGADDWAAIAEQQQR